MQTYPRSLILLHWLMAVAMIAAFILGDVMEDMPRGPEKLTVIGWHVLAGLTIAALVIPRILTRVSSTTPMPQAMPRWQVLLAKLAHLVLYAAMLIMPASGLVSILSGSRPLSVLGLFSLSPVAAMPWLHTAAGTVHGIAAKVFLVTLILHVLATLWHSLIRRDGLAARMIPFLAR